MGRRTLSPAAAAVVAALVVVVAARGVAGQARPPRCGPRAARADCRRLDRHGTSVYEFTVQGKYFGMEYVDGKYISVRCGEGGPSLESPSLPTFETELNVERVAIDRCAPAPYAAVFRALNVTVAQSFNLSLANTGGGGGLEGAHLAGLAGVRALTLRNAGAPRGPLLARLPALAALTVAATTLPAGELDAPPSRLAHLYLTDAGVSRVPAAILALPRLRSLTVMGEGVVHVERHDDAALRYLCVSEAEEALLAQWAPPALEVAYLSKWAAAAPAPLPACASLATLTLVAPATRRLPPGWTARCPRLATLEVTFAAHLTTLPERLLANATSLTRLVLRSGALTHLPPDLFDDTPRLAHLDLSGNHLKELPSGALGATSSSLVELNLSSNELTSGVGGALVALRQLRQLSLANNKRLTDLCRPDPDTYITVVKNKSPLASLSRLETLNLKNTNVTVICSDWRLDLPLLADLDLRGTRIATLVYEDLKYTRHVRSLVQLQNTPLHDVLFTAEDYDEAHRAGRTRPSNVTVALGGAGASLACDCYLYWFVKALEEGLLPVSGAGGVRCAGAAGAVGDARADDLLCEAAAGACPAPLSRGCTCGAAGGLRSGRAVLRVRCVGAGLTRVPRLPALDDTVGAVDLLLPNNSIDTLTRDDIPSILRTLDLQNNSIERIEEATAVALVGRVDRRVQLADNPLDCSCRLAGARRVLRAGHRQLQGYDSTLRCSDGRLVGEVSEAECAATAPALAASLAGLAAAAALAVAAAGARHAGALGRLKALLRRLGCGRDVDAAAARPYDAFVTFGRGDEAAALEVTARLERGAGAGAGARRVVLQERDWLPPAWVPHCVEASVRAARTTVALVSPAWERWLENAEVRAAYEPAWRGALVLVLPPAPAPGAPAPGVTDSALRRYARDYPHLVLRRGERGFWRGLQRALPPPPPPPPPV